MSETSANNKRIAKNTAMLYVRTIVILFVTLYSSRIILRGLGIVDYGIYNVVGGFIAMFAVLSNSLSAAISRFITFELGRGNKERLNMIFSTSIKTQIYLSLIILLLAETVGLWFLNTYMVFPPERVEAANWVYQFSILTFIVNLISVPYNACIIAHEHMKAFAYFSILQALLGLGVAFLIEVSPDDRLVFYAVMMAVVAFVIRISYGIYCGRHFEECHFRWRTDKTLVKEMSGFAGWNFIGAASGVLRDQGINVVLNLFCGPVVNAARGISMQVSAAVSSFAGNFTMAINPQITKRFAAGEREYTMKLVFQGARLSFYLLLFMSLPILMETHYVLWLWLGEIPEHSVNFVRLILLYVMSESISNTMITLMLATGDIKKYQILVGGCQMLNLPVAYVLMRIGCQPETTFIGSIAIAVCCLFLRMYMLRGMVQFPVRRFISSVLLNIITVGLLSVILPLCVSHIMPEGILRFLITGFTCVLSVAVAVFFVGCSAKERAFVIEKSKHYIFKKI